MESLPETGHGETGECVKKSKKKYSGLQGFELREMIENVWTNNTGEKEEQRKLNLRL